MLIETWRKRTIEDQQGRGRQSYTYIFSKELLASHLRVDKENMDNLTEYVIKYK